MNGRHYKPYIPAEKIVPEFTLFAVIFGAIVSIVFSGANAYLGLRVGMTISASIPAAVISMGIMRKVLKRDSILENNLVQTIASAGESVAAGVIFTIPAIFLWSEEGLCDEPSVISMTLLAMAGGIIGTMLMIPLRKALIVEEHGNLIYPEGTACAEVLIAGEEGGSKSKLVFAGLGVAALYKLIVDGLKIVSNKVTWQFSFLKGGGVGISTMPALTGVGYICGFRVSSYLFAGGLLSWIGLMPILVAFGGDSVVAPATLSVEEVWNAGGLDGIWDSYIRYIGAGALISGGLIGMFKIVPMLINMFKTSSKPTTQLGTSSIKRTDKDLPFWIIIVVTVAVLAFLMFYPGIEINWLGALLILGFGIFFTVVASRMVGLIGASNNPVSGMSIATLLFTTLILKAAGYDGMPGMLMAIAIGTVICVILANAGDMSQDLKTGFLVGATPRIQQIGEIIGVTAASLTIGAVLFLLNEAWGFGSDELGAPQATMMKLIVEGIMQGNVPWTLILMGAAIGIVIFVVGLPVLPFAIGMYLPIQTTAAIMIGGIIRLAVDKWKYANDKLKEEAGQAGILFSSGLIAGEGIVGILLALFAILTVDGTEIATYMDLSNVVNFGDVGSIIFFVIFIAITCRFIFKEGRAKKYNAEKSK